MPDQIPPFTSYDRWHDFTTRECGLKLTSEYCRERVAALENPADPATESFTQCYGSAYRNSVISWFQRASDTAS